MNLFCTKRETINDVGIKIGKKCISKKANLRRSKNCNLYISIKVDKSGNKYIVNTLSLCS